MLTDNIHAVERSDIKSGNCFYFFFEGEFHRIVIGRNINPDNMAVNINGKKGIKLTPQMLWSEMPNQR